MIIHNAENRSEISRDTAVHQLKSRNIGSTPVVTNDTGDNETLSIDAVEVTTSDKEPESKKKPFFGSTTAGETEESPASAPHNNQSLTKGELEAHIDIRV